MTARRKTGAQVWRGVVHNLTRTGLATARRRHSGRTPGCCWRPRFCCVVPGGSPSRDPEFLCHCHSRGRLRRLVICRIRGLLTGRDTGPNTGQAEVADLVAMVRAWAVRDSAAMDPTRLLIPRAIRKHRRPLIGRHNHIPGRPLTRHARGPVSLDDRPSCRSV